MIDHRSHLEASDAEQPLHDAGKAELLELADDLLDRHLGALSPGAHDLRDAGLNPNIS